MKKWKRVAMMAIVGLMIPFWAEAQIADELKGLHKVLDQLYDEMMPMCSQLISVGSGLAGFAALWFISSRVWKHLSNAEPIDFYPLLRPFAIGFCVLNFTAVLNIINGVMKPTVTATASMVEDSDRTIRSLLEQREKAVKETDQWKMYVGDNQYGDREKWLKYTQDDEGNNGSTDEGFWESIGNDFKFAAQKMSYNFRNTIKEWMAEVLRVLFEAAALCINTLRTFQLVVLAILGPLVFGLAVFDGFTHTLTIWLARYINIFLWLPVANIFGAIIGKIQENMLKMDLSQIDRDGDTFFTSADTGYLIFMIIGIVGYFTVPSVANYIVHAASGGALPQKVSNMAGSVTRSSAMMVSSGAARGGTAILGGTAMAADSLGDGNAAMKNSMAAQGNSSGYFNDKLQGNS